MTEQIKTRAQESARAARHAVQDKFGFWAYVVVVTRVEDEVGPLLWATTANGSGVIITNRLLTSLALANEITLSGTLSVSITPPAYMPAWDSMGDDMDDPADGMDLIVLVHTPGTPEAPSILEVHLDPIGGASNIVLVLKHRPPDWPR